MNGVKITDDQLDRAAGVLLAQACGDALGVPYEFQEPDEIHDPLAMSGGGLGDYDRGEWSDDTEMALCIGDALLAEEPDSEAMYDGIARHFLRWFPWEPKGWARDVGNQTRKVLSAAEYGVARGESPAQACRTAAAGCPDGAGNGALMRTGIVGAACLCDRERTAELCRQIAALTHAHADVEDTCVLWTEAVRLAVVKDWQAGGLLGEEHLLSGLDLIVPERRTRCEAWVRESTGVEPSSFGHNGYTVKTLKAAWAAITSSQAQVTLKPDAAPEGYLTAGLETAVHAGWDTDTVAAVAGQLLGARWGASAVSQSSRDDVRGRAPSRGGGLYELRRGEDLVRLAREVARKGAAGC